jgi:hypothetical protein
MKLLSRYFCRMTRLQKKKDKQPPNPPQASQSTCWVDMSSSNPTHMGEINLRRNAFSSAVQSFEFYLWLTMIDHSSAWCRHLIRLVAIIG